MAFEKSKWIWYTQNDGEDEYGEFFAEFCAKVGQRLTLRLSVDGDYTLFVNGKFAESNQYGDFEHYKIYDEIDITSLSKDGKNTLSFVVWHHGRSTSRYKSAKAGLIFELLSDGECILASSADTPSRQSPCYESHRCRLITRQLGFGYHYDARGDDGSLYTGEGFARSVEVQKSCEFYKRSIKKLLLDEKEHTADIRRGADGSHFLIDLSEETVGVLTLRFTSRKEQRIRVDWGEHLDGGHVRRIIGDRDFSIDYTAKPGFNAFTGYMLRLGCRYLEVWAEEPIELEYAGLIRQYYPVTEKKVKLDSEEDERIYRLCVNTLKLSMMEHYVDCPWREQAFYAFDSRNQMLSGYYAFEDMNAEYARANLILISKDDREGGLLSICYPTGVETAIPSFSLHYFTAVLEYFDHTKDTELLRCVYPKLVSIINVFHGNVRDGLVHTFPGRAHWNFYDWSEHLDGSEGRGGEGEWDSVINMLYIMALRSLERISEALGENFELKGEADIISENVRRAFYDKESGLFSFRIGKDDHTELANSLAILSGVAKVCERKEICEKILSGKTTASSLSLKCFLYDALIMTDKEKYRPVILSEIRKNYTYMLECGASAAWETIKGKDDFGGAGSLCHGWSAIPVYYYNKFGIVK